MDKNKCPFYTCATILYLFVSKMICVIYHCIYSQNTEPVKTAKYDFRTIDGFMMSVNKNDGIDYLEY